MIISKGVEDFYCLSFMGAVDEGWGRRWLNILMAFDRFFG